MTKSLLILGSLRLLSRLGVVRRWAGQGTTAIFTVGQSRKYGAGTPSVYRYTSQRWNDKLDLYDYNARYYLPNIGRFLSADTLVPNPANPQSFNRYAYVLNNPLAFTDPSGHCAEDGDDACWSLLEDIERTYGININIWESSSIELLQALAESLNIYKEFLGGDLFNSIYGGMIFNYFAPQTPNTQETSFSGLAGDGVISLLNSPSIVSIARTMMGITNPYINLVLTIAHEMAHFIVNPPPNYTKGPILTVNGLGNVYQRFRDISGWIEESGITIPPRLNGIPLTSTAYGFLTSGQNGIAEDAAESLAVSLVVGTSALYPYSPNIIQITQSEIGLHKRTK